MSAGRTVAVARQAELSEEAVKRAVRREVGRVLGVLIVRLPGSSRIFTLTETTAGSTRSTMSANDAGPDDGGAIAVAGAPAAAA